MDSIFALITSIASFKAFKPSVFSGVDVVITYNGGAIKLILIGSSSVESDNPAFKADFTASIPSYP